MYRSSNKFEFYLFADDTNLLLTEKDLKNLEIIANEKLFKLYEWLNSNKLSLNRAKSNLVIFHSYERKRDYATKSTLKYLITILNTSYLSSVKHM